MLTRLQQGFDRYPRAFWLVLIVFFFNRASAALIWPFLSLNMRESLDVPLAVVTTLVSIQAFAGLIAASFTGAIMDRFGRKKAMAFGLVAWSVVLVGMSASHELWQWAILLVLYGIFQPAFYTGSFAMVADIVQPEERAGAYAIARTVTNLAIATGPAVGAWFVATTQIPSYHVTAAISIILVIPFMLFIAETKPAQTEANAPSFLGGYRQMLGNRPFMTFFGAYVILEFAISLVFTLLPVYAKENFAIPQERYSILLTVNAGMVVLFQVLMTRWTSRYRPLPMLVIGTLFYVFGLTGFGLSSLLIHFAISMGIMTTGELIIAPTSASMVANLAPVDMRARYMGIFSVAYTIGSGIGPIIGGFLSDAIAPAAIWYGGAVFSFLALVGFAAMNRQSLKQKTTIETQPVEPGYTKPVALEP